MHFISKKDTPRIDQAIQYITQLDNTKDWSIEIKPYKKNLTRDQRNYYHALLGIISDYSGDDIDDLKTRMCFTLGYVRTVRLRDKTEVLVRRSTESLTREEYSQMIDAARMACLELGLSFPHATNYGL